MRAWVAAVGGGAVAFAVCAARLHAGARGAHAESRDASPGAPSSTPQVSLTELEGRFSQETVDVAWSAAQEDRIRDEARRLATPGSAVTSVLCRSTLCRLEGTFATRQAFTAIMHGIFGNPAPDRVRHAGAVAPLVEANGAGAWHAVVFTAREGTQLLASSASDRGGPPSTAAQGATRAVR